MGAKQATDLQHELETLARRQSVLEDEELEVMEQREAVGMDVQHAQRTLDEAQGHHAADHRAARHGARRHRRGRGRAAAATGRRSSQTSRPTCSPSTTAAVRAAAPAPRSLRERRCGACRLELDRTAIAALRSAPPDEVVHCEECGTVLVRTPQSGL